jgi:hypothetical protein
LRWTEVARLSTYATIALPWELHGSFWQYAVRRSLPQAAMWLILFSRSQATRSTKVVVWG